MTQTFMQMFNIIKIRRFIRKFYGSVVRSASNDSISKCEHHQDRIIAAPCLSSPISYSSRVHGFKRCMFVTPIQNCSVNILPSILMRHYCTKHDKFPHLTRLKCSGYPSALASLSNFFLTHLVIKPHLDESFSTYEFLQTSKKVVESVSSRIAAADFEALKDLVTTEVLEEVKTNLPKFSVSQRQDLAFTDEELLYSFLDTISLNVDNENNTKSLEILTIHHGIKGMQEMKKLTENFHSFDAETVQKTLRQSKPRSFVLNYRFLRKFHSSGEADDWIINGVQHQSGKSINMNFF